MSWCERVRGYLGVIWWIVLDDPVHLGDVQTSGSHVRAQQDARVGVTELEEGGGSLGLLLLTLRGGMNCSKVVLVFFNGSQTLVHCEYVNLLNG